jgi:hypothetical protein
MIKKFNYPFTPVTEMPWMKVRCAKKNKITGGRVIIVEAARSWSQSVRDQLGPM